MKNDNSQSPDKSLIPFIQAQEWNKEIALAKSDFLELSKKFIEAHKGDLGKGPALKRFLDSFNKGLIGNSIKEKLRRNKISKSTYYDWRDRHRKMGLSGLLEGYNNGGIRIHPSIREEIEKLIWKNHLCRYQDVFEDLKVLFPTKKLPSYSTIRNYAKQYKSENWAALVLKHEGQKGLRDRNMQVTLGKMDEALSAPNQKWEIDTTIADLFTGRKVKDVFLKTSEGKRCKIIGIMDVYSRSVRFYLTVHETGMVVGQVIRDRILAWGIPEELVIDNGKPYKNKRIRNFLIGVGIATHICIPGNPVEKPHIERVFRTLSEKLFRRLPGYSGNSVQNRPNEIEIKYTMEKLQQIMDSWTANVYAETVHRSTGQRPRERMAAPGFTPKTIAERELDILLMEEIKRKVSQGYISYDSGRYFHPSLPEGETVKFRVNDFNASEIIVFKDNKFLCVAEDFQRKGKTPKDIREAKKQRTQELKTRVKAHSALIDKQDTEEVNILGYIEHCEKNKPAELPRKAELIQFPELTNIPFTKTGQESQEIHSSENLKEAEANSIRTPIIKNNREMYLNVMGRKMAGKELDDFDLRFLEDFTASNEYRLLKPFFEKKLGTGGSH